VTAQPDVGDLWDEFHEVVNMTSRELRDWLATDASGELSEDLPDQAGPETGRRVLDILGKRRMDVTDEDMDVMRAVVDLVRTEHPDPERGDLTDDAWRHRLMSVGHDPLKASQ
jgi:hypothetical protein